MQIGAKETIFGRRRRRSPRRRRSWLNEKRKQAAAYATRVANKAATYAKEKLTKACESAISGLSSAMTAACNVPKTVANAALDKADKLLSAISEAANAALSFAASAVEKALQAIKKLTAYAISSVEFKMTNSIGPSVSLNAAILNTGTQAITNYGINLSLTGISFKKLAQEAFTAIFQPIKKQALKIVTSLKDKVATAHHHTVIMCALINAEPVHLLDARACQVCTCNPAL